MTRGALTTFSIANDVAKYFAILPAMFAGVFPVLNALNIMHLRTPQVGVRCSRPSSSQRAHHRHSAHTVGAARRGNIARPLPAAMLRTAQPADLRCRWHRHTVYRHQGHRPCHHRHWPCLEVCSAMKRHLITACLYTAITAVSFLALPIHS